jgi:enoyl-CoA hydratase
VALISQSEARAFAALIAAKSRRALVLAKQALNGLEPRDVLRTC